MIKKVVSLILSICIIAGTISAFAEMDLKDELNNKIISTENFTDENVIYSALRDMNNGVSFFSDTPEKITSDFDVVFGFDMSSNMYGFDYNGDMLWLDNFRALSEQTPDGTRFAVVTGEASEFTYDLDTAINTAVDNGYSGESNIVSLLDSCLNTFNSVNRNNIVIATTAKVDDKEALMEKMDELRDYGVIPFVFVLNTDENENYNYNGVYICNSKLVLRLTISELYLSFFEFRTSVNTLYKTEDIYMEPSNGMSSNSDLKERNIYDGADTTGSALISVLNMYGCLPFGASKGINDYNLTSVLENLSVEKRVLFVRGQTDLINGIQIIGFKELWENIYTDEKKSHDVFDIIKSNLIKRFPVVIEYQLGDTMKTGIVTSLSADQAQINFGEYINIDNVASVFDTYDYFSKIAISSKKTISTIAYTSNMSNEVIEKSYIASYDTSNVSVLKCTENDTISISEVREGNVLRITADMSNFTNHENDDEKRTIITAAKVKITEDNIPELYDNAPIYIIRLYKDIPSTNVWYWNYLLKATNLGIINGDENGAYNPDSLLTRCQFIKMLIEASQINTDNAKIKWDTNHWAVDYMNKANELGILYWDDTRKDDEIDKYFDEEIPRYEAAYILKKLIMDKSEEIQIPTQLYNYPANIESEAAVRWNTLSKQFNEVSSSSMESMRQLFMNNIFVGDEHGDLKLYDKITKAQATKIVIKPLFEIDEDLLQIVANVFEDGAVEPINLQLNSNGIKLDDIVFDNNNERKYVLTIDKGDQNKYFAELSEDSNAELSINSNDSSGCTLEIINNMKCYTLQGEGTYNIIIKRQGNSVVGLKISNINKINKLEFNPQSGGKYIFSNNKENIELDDLADSNNKNGSQLLFYQKDLKTGTYTLMMEHQNKIQELQMDIYVDIQFHSEDPNASITIKKYGDDEFGAGHENDKGPKSWACIAGYASFWGSKVGRVRDSIPDVDKEDPTENWYNNSLIVPNATMEDKIQYPQHNFINANTVWLSELYKYGKYPVLKKDEGLYIIMEFEIISDVGVELSVAAFEENSNLSFENRFAQYQPTTMAPYKYNKSLKGSAEFKPETEAKLEFIVDDSTEIAIDKEIDDGSASDAQVIELSNVFFPEGIKTKKWKTHMPAMAEEWGASINCDSDILPIKYKDTLTEKEWIFDTKHSDTGDNNVLEATLNSDGGSANAPIASSLGNYSVKETYNITVTNLTNQDKIFTYTIQTKSNMFLSVRNDDNTYKLFDVNGEKVSAICTGDAKNKGSIYDGTLIPIDSDESDVKVRLPIFESEEEVWESAQGEKPQLMNPNNITELQIVIPAKKKTTFYIDEVLATGDAGAINTWMSFKNR